MMVEILLFAGLKELGGTGGVRIKVSETATFGELRQALAQSHPQLAPLLHHCRFAQGNMMVEDGAKVAPSGKIALIPPVSGG